MMADGRLRQAAAELQVASADAVLCHAATCVIASDESEHHQALLVTQGFENLGGGWRSAHGLRLSYTLKFVNVLC